MELRSRVNVIMRGLDDLELINVYSRQAFSFIQHFYCYQSLIYLSIFDTAHELTALMKIRWKEMDGII